MRALVVEQGWSRGALAAVRALAAAGWTVGVGAPRGGGLAGSSAACRRLHRVPAAHADVAGFLSAVADAVRCGGYEVVFGAGEAEVLVLSEHRHRIPAVVPHGDHDVVRSALDKHTLHEAGRTVGFRVPRVLDADTLTGDLPYVVKARLHARPGVAGVPPRIDTLVVTGAEAARARARELRDLGAVPIVQEFTEGSLMAYSAVVDAHGRIIAEAQQVASRIWPPDAGASCRARTVDIDEHLSARAAALFARLGWTGLAELQLLVPREGGPVLIDLNGRFYGSLSLAVRAGANLPDAWARMATGRATVPSRARGGVRYQWLHGDARRALRKGSVPDLLATAAYAPRAVHSVLTLTDPRPGWTLLRAQLAPEADRA